MSDLISRQAAIDALESEKTYCTAFLDGYTSINVFEKYNAGIVDGIKALKRLPSAQPERKKGEWIVDDEFIDCSVCRREKWSRIPYGDLVRRFRYCPNCGADMRGE